MTPASTEHHAPGRSIRLGLVGAFALALIFYIVESWHWPLIWDMQVLHYVSFLMDRGWAPYRQIGDMNMPGAYLFEHWALLVFGSADVGWRLWDFTLLAVLAAGMLSISRTYDWLAGVIAAGLFILTHAAEGPQNAGQREQVMATLMIGGTALLFEGVRRQKAWPLFGFGLLTALASSVKPTVIFFGPLALALAVLPLRRAGEPVRRYMLAALAGFVLASLIVLQFLVVHGSLRAFVTLLTQVLPHYAGINQPTWPHLLLTALQFSVLFYIVCAVLAFALNRQRAWNWEQAVLLLGALFGLLSFLGQHKGFIQHRYPLTAFLLLWGTIHLVLALHSASTAPRWIAAAALLFAMVFYIPRNLYWIHSQVRHDDFSSYLESDLRQLGPDALQHEVQCLDIVSGCLNALYHLQIVQSTGSTGDLLLFLPEDAPEVERARTAFWAAISKASPEVYVLVNWQFGVTRRTFAKVDTWPQFADYLQSQYVLVQQWDFPKGQKPFVDKGGNPDMPAYRIYVRRDGALLAKAAAVGLVAQAGPH